MKKRGQFVRLSYDRSKSLPFYSLGLSRDGNLNSRGERQGTGYRGG